MGERLSKKRLREINRLFGNYIKRTDKPSITEFTDKHKLRRAAVYEMDIFKDNMKLLKRKLKGELNEGILIRGVRRKYTAYEKAQMLIEMRRCVPGVKTVDDISRLTGG